MGGDDSKGQSSKVNHVQKVVVSVRSSDGGSFGDCGKIGMALKVSNFVGSDTWIIDSGASDHMTYDKSYFTDLSSPPVSYVTNANGEAFPVLGSGSVRITPTLELHNVLYVPDLSHHLISVPQLNTESKCSVTFYPMYVIFQDLLTREKVGQGYLRGRLFHLDQTYAGEKPGAQSLVALTSNSDKISEIWLWHRRLGHPPFSLMKTTMPTLFIGVNESALRCETCVLAKSHRATYSPRVSNKSVIPFELIHSDVWGPSREPTVSGMRYFVLFIDDCTRLSWVALLKTKDEVFPAFRTFRTLVQTQYHSTIKVFRSDNGGNMLIMFSKSFLTPMGLFTKPHVHKHLNKMECLKGKTVIYLIWLVPFSLVPICLSIFGVMLYMLPPILSIVFPLVSFREKFHLRFLHLMSPYLHFIIFQLVSLVVLLLSMFLRTRGLNWMPGHLSVCLLAMEGIRKGTSAFIHLPGSTMSLWMLLSLRI
ncbi:putative RNA-directed DNA polymerase [Rosa chinensis]|uniref:Putative RNA-directed DNA polymerase n=1 Tax=Rosa chinensis TaxID=74649 RepID=A0A2P6PGT1_ROSCH|nr:putative RNA-directed DNA polymerase [Rosa chinensis]